MSRRGGGTSPRPPLSRPRPRPASPPPLAPRALADPRKPPSPRELEVLRLVADGATLQEASRALSLSQGTARNYVSAAIAKTGARNRFDAVRIAREWGWL